MNMRLGPISISVTLLGAMLAYLYQDAVRNGVKATVIRTMACSKERAFDAVTDFEAMPQISSDVLGYEFIDEPPMHLNMRFFERRKMGSGELVTHLQVTEFNPETAHARMVADAHGTIWDTLFDVYPGKKGEEVVLVMAMHAEAHELLPKLINPIMQVLFRQGLNSHMNQVKSWCERTR